jgi:hypothetical protein
MNKLLLIIKAGNFIVECVIWKHNLLIKKDYLYNFNHITCNHIISTIKLSFKKFPTLKELKEEIITKKKDPKIFSQF